MSDGIQGYSVPVGNTVVFSISDERIELFNEFARYQPEIKKNLVRGTGRYKGVAERSFALPQAVFDWMRFSRPELTHDQESFLILEQPEARNWRKAYLSYQDSRPREFLGIWKSGTFADLADGKDYTAFPRNAPAVHQGELNYFIVEQDPPTSPGMAFINKAFSKQVDDAMYMRLQISQTHKEGYQEGFAAGRKAAYDELGLVLK